MLNGYCAKITFEQLEKLFNLDTKGDKIFNIEIVPSRQVVKIYIDSMDAHPRNEGEEFLECYTEVETLGDCHRVSIGL